MNQVSSLSAVCDCLFTQDDSGSLGDIYTTLLSLRAQQLFFNFTTASKLEIQLPTYHRIIEHVLVSQRSTDFSAFTNNRMSSPANQAAFYAQKLVKAKAKFERAADYFYEDMNEKFRYSAGWAGYQENWVKIRNYMGKDLIIWTRC
jgi:hypothetical protein